MLQELVNNFVSAIEIGHTPDITSHDYSINKKGRASDIKYALNNCSAAIASIKNSKQNKLQIEYLISSLQKFLLRHPNSLSLDTLTQSTSLTAILNSIRKTIDDINKIQNLPPEAGIIKSETVKVATEGIQKTEKLQVTSKEFITLNYPKLEKVKLDLEDPSVPIESIRLMMEEISNNAHVLKQEVEKSDINSILVKVGEMTSKSIALENTYKNKVSALEVQISEAEKKLADAESERWYYLALGILGIPGVIAAAVIISNLTNDLNKLKDEINKYKSELLTVKTFAGTMSSFTSLFNELFGQIGYLKNDIDFIIGQLTNIIENLENPSVERPTLVLYVITTLETFKQLEADVS